MTTTRPGDTSTSVASAGDTTAVDSPCSADASPARRRALKAMGLAVPFAAGCALGFAPEAGAVAERKVDLAGAKTGAVRLDSNENPYGPSPAAHRAGTASIADGCRYADGDIDPLAAALAARDHLATEQVVLGSGSGELIHMAALLAAEGGPGGELVAAHPTFEELEEFAAKFGVATKWVPMDARHRHDLPAMQAAIGPKTRLVYVCNPNNPTATVVPRAELVRFIRAVPAQTLVLVDEAYIDFVTDPAAGPVIDLVDECRNLIVIRTFSKIHGLAGLRMGYAYANADLARRLRDKQLAFPNVAALRAARASLGDTHFLTQTRRAILKDRDRVEALVDRMGCARAASQGNFVFFDTGRPVKAFRDAMRARGIRVGRPFAGYDTWSRITIGTTPEVDRLLAALSVELKPRA